MKKTLLIAGMTAGLMLVASAPMAHANLITYATLTLSDGTPADTQTVTSTSPIPNQVTYNGVVGADWTVNVSTGTGQSTQPVIDLNTVDKITGGSVPLTITFWDSQYTVAGLTEASIGGTIPSGWTISFDTFSIQGATTTPLTSQSFTGGPKGGFFGGNQLGADVSLTGGTLEEVIVITPSSHNEASFDAGLSVPDGGMTMLMLGGAFTALARLSKIRSK